MDITFYGAAGTVTGSCFLLKTKEGYNILIDCGLFQGRKEVKERNYGNFEFEPSEIDVLLLTHAHIDHSGLIPKLCKHGFTGKIYTTTASKELCSILLPDSGHIQEMEVERKNRKLSRANKTLLEPIYTVEDAEKCMQYFQGVKYDEKIEILPGIHANFRDAGHILGSAMIELYVNDKKIVFSGDIGNINQPIINDPSKITSADYIIMESTYGNRFHLETESKLVQLARIINRTHRKGGNVIIPAFAIERTQELIYDLRVLIERNEIPNMDVYIDSPLAIKATEIFCKYPICYDEEATRIEEKGECCLYFPNLKFSLTAEESKKLNTLKNGNIIISASGMCDAGRIKHHLKHNLWKSNATVLFVGYQAQGTLGRRILEGEKTVKIHGEEIAINAEIQKIEGFSAHADQKGLIDWVNKFTVKPPKKIFVVHGEQESRENLASIINQEIGIETVLPEFNSIYSLSNEETEKIEEKIVGNDVKIKTAFMALQNIIQDLKKQNISKEFITEEIEKLKENIFSS